MEIYKGRVSLWENSPCVLLHFDTHGLWSWIEREIFSFFAVLPFNWINLVFLNKFLRAYINSCQTTMSRNNFDIPIFCSEAVYAAITLFSSRTPSVQRKVGKELALAKPSSSNCMLAWPAEEWLNLLIIGFLSSQMASSPDHGSLRVWISYFT